VPAAMADIWRTWVLATAAGDVAGFHAMNRVNSGVIAAKISAASSGIKGRSSSRGVEMTVSMIFAWCTPDYSPAEPISGRPRRQGPSTIDLT
jgi:hypothetical protein